MTGTTITAFTRRAVSLAAAFLIASALGVFAEDRLPAPTGPVILTIDGAIRITTDGTEAALDREMLTGLGMQSLTTTNPFVKGVQTYEGVLLSKVLDLVGARGDAIAATALDGYSVDIPVADVRSYPILLALKWNGEFMRVRDKGPLWVIYPIDQNSELNTEAHASRSIWQLTRLTLK